MNRGEKDAVFFEQWRKHRHRYYTKKATCAILVYSTGLLFVFNYIDLVINPHLLIPFILIIGLGILLIAIYFLISNPPTNSDYQSISNDEKEE